VTSAASVGGSERLRLFLGFPLPEQAVDELAAWQRRELRGRIVPPENLHVTLAFLGSRPAGDLPSVLGVLGAAAAGAQQPRFVVERYRETRSVGMLELRDGSGAAAALAVRLHDDLARLGVYRPEARPWLPHVTVLRFRERPRLRPRPPELEWVSSDAAAFLSRLHAVRAPSGGARYEVLESFPLGG
jgi:RNA 2',3'-cyclic 3'-phosphodiesterase